MISVIIPTYQEAEQIGRTIAAIKGRLQGEDLEIIVTDGGSTDGTCSISEENGARVIVSEKKGRAAQMNCAAREARGDVFYFLHADSRPPARFIYFIHHALAEGAVGGCFRLAFDHDHWFLKANAWFTRFNINALRFGDQSLFVRKEVFNSCGGFREDLYMMEDQEIIHRIRKHGKFRVMKPQVVTSARKYLDNGIYRMQFIFFRIWFLYYMGYSQQKLLDLHRRLIRKHKL